MACPPLPPRLRLDRFELTGDWHRDRLGFVYLTKQGVRLREHAPADAERVGVRAEGKAGDFLERGRRLGFEVLDLPEGRFWVAPDPPGEPVGRLTPALLEQLAERLDGWHRAGLGHGALTLSCLRLHEGRLEVLDALGDLEGDLEALRSLGRQGDAHGPVVWASHADSAREVLKALRMEPRAAVARPSSPLCPRPTPEPHQGWIRCVAFRRCELFSGGEDKVVQGPGLRWQVGSWVSALATWEDRLVAVLQDARVVERRPTGDQTLLEWASPALAFAPDGRLVVALSTGEVPGFGMHPTPVHALTFSPDGQLLVVAAGTMLALWTADGQFLERREATGALRTLAFLPDGRLVTSGSELLLWDLYSGTVRRLAGSTRCVAGSGRGFASADLNKVVWFHPLPQLTPVRLGQHTGEVSSVAVSPDGRWVASGGQDQVVGVWPTRA